MNVEASETVPFHKRMRRSHVQEPEWRSIMMHGSYHNVGTYGYRRMRYKMVVRVHEGVLMSDRADGSIRDLCVC